MAVLLDSLLVFLFSFCVLSGWKRGFIKVFGGLIALVAATLVSNTLSPAAAVLAADYFALPPTQLHSLCSMVLFLLVYVAVQCLLRWLDIVAKLPLIKQLNRLLGLVAGALSGALWALFAIGVVTAVAWLGWIPTLTPTVLEETQVFAWLNTLTASLP